MMHRAGSITVNAETVRLSFSGMMTTLPESSPGAASDETTPPRLQSWKQKSVSFARRKMTESRKSIRLANLRKSIITPKEVKEPIRLPRDVQEYLTAAYLRCDGLTRAKLPDLLREVGVTVPVDIDDVADPFFESALIMQPDGFLRLVQRLMPPVSTAPQEETFTLVKHAFAAMNGDEAPLSGSMAFIDGPKRSINRDDVRDGMGADFPEEFVDEVVEQVQGLTSFGDMQQRLYDPHPDDALVVDAFRRLGATNPDGLGYALDTDTLRSRCQSLGLTSEEATLIVNLLDRDASGEVDLREFRKTLVDARHEQKGRTSAATKLLFGLSMQTGEARQELLAHADTGSFLMSRDSSSFANLLAANKRRDRKESDGTLLRDRTHLLDLGDYENSESSMDDEEMERILEEMKKLGDKKQEPEVTPRFMLPQQRSERDEVTSAGVQRVHLRKKREQLRRAHRQGKEIEVEGVDIKLPPSSPSLPLAVLMKGPVEQREVSVTPQPPKYLTATSTPRTVSARGPKHDRLEDTVSSTSSRPRFRRLCGDALVNLRHRLDECGVPHVRMEVDDKRPDFSCSTPRYTQRGLQMSTPSDLDRSASPGLGTSRQDLDLSSGGEDDERPHTSSPPLNPIQIEMRRFHDTSRATYGKSAIRTSAIRNAPLYTQDGSDAFSADKRAQVIQQPRPLGASPRQRVSQQEKSTPRSPQAASPARVEESPAVRGDSPADGIPAQIDPDVSMEPHAPPRAPRSARARPSPRFDTGGLESGKHYQRTLHAVVGDLVLVPSARAARDENRACTQYQHDRLGRRRDWEARTLQRAKAGVERSKRRWVQEPPSVKTLSREERRRMVVAKFQENIKRNLNGLDL